MITVQINGSEVTLQQPMPLDELLRTVQVPANYLAVEINDDVVPKNDHGTTLVKQGDRIEVVTLVGGG